MTSAPALILEQLENEVKIPSIAAGAEKALKEGASLQTILAPLYTAFLPEASELAKAFEAHPPAATAFLRAKRRLLEAQEWLNGVKKGCLALAPQDRLLTEAEAAIHAQLLLLDSHLPALLSAAKERGPADYAASLKTASKELEHITERCIVQAQDNEEKHLWETRHRLILQQAELLTHFAMQQQEWSLQALLQGGKSLYLTHFANLHLSLLYSWKGPIYLVMDVLAQRLGSGAAKTATRTIELQTGKIFAFVRPKFLFTEAKDEKEAALLREHSFQGLWRESEFLLQLRGTPGIICALERFRFQIDGAKHLVVIENRYEDGPLEKVFNELIDKKSQAAGYEEKAIAIALQLLTGLEQLHRLQIIHRDIKPDNILCDWSGPSLPEAVLCDFNGACTVRETRELKQFVFSPLYGAPEAVDAYLRSKGTAESAPASPFGLDIWAMGLTLYQLFFLERFPWYSTVSTKENIKLTFDRIRSLKEGWIPQKWAAHRFYPLISAMLRVDPKQRTDAKKALETISELK